MTTLIAALAALRPGSAFTMLPDDFATLRWQDPDRDQPTLDAVLAKQAELEAEARIDAVKAEARRRITQRFPDWKQANMTARGVELTFKLAQGQSLDAQEAAEVAALQAAWSWIKAVRAASDAIEALAPMPADFASDTHWPESG
jgi:hypothetical protein